jgi:cellobiose epimerase
MNELSRILELRQAMHRELFKHILPYWSNKVFDVESGQFHGRIDSENIIHPDADRSAVLYSRIAFSYAASFSNCKDISLLPKLNAALDVLESDFTDPENGGLYWMVKADGSPADTKKHIYAQSFGIYAFSTTYKATGEEKALTQAIALFELVESHAYIADKQAYYEAFDQKWNRLDDVRLGSDDAHEPRSTNTHLHILEAYTALYLIWPDVRLKSRLETLIRVFLEKIYNESQHRFFSFFDENWIPRGSVYSYGHDIETVWLLLDAAKTIDDSELIIRCEFVARNVSDSILGEAIHPEFGGLFNSGLNGAVLDTDLHWWAQAEAIVGLLHVYLITQEESYLSAIESLWKAIQRVIIDHEHGEWHFRVNKEGIPYKIEDKVGPWKCPYHTSRACLMVLELTDDLVKTNQESETISK